jgi:hypothetical protein
MSFMTIPASSNILNGTDFGFIVRTFADAIETPEIKGQLLFVEGRKYLTFRSLLIASGQEKQSFLLEIIDMPNESQRFYCMYTESSTGDEKQNVVMLQEGIDFKDILPAYLAEVYKTFSVSNHHQSIIRAATEAFHAQWLLEMAKG